MEIGLFIVTSLVLVSLEISLIILIIKHFQNIIAFLDNIEKKFNLFHKQLQDIKIDLLNLSIQPSKISLQGKNIEELTEQKNHKTTQNNAQNHSLKESAAPPTLLQKQQGNIPLLKNLSPDEIPKDLQKLDILNTTKIVNGKHLPVNPQKVVVGKPGEQIKIDIKTNKKASV